MLKLKNVLTELHESLADLRKSSRLQAFHDHVLLHRSCKLPLILIGILPGFKSQLICLI